VRAVTDNLFRAACGYGVVAAAGGKPVRPPASGLEGYDVTGGVEHRAVLEFVAGDEVIARKVVAMGNVECWLRADLIQPTLDRMAADQAETERVIRELSAFAEATRPVPMDQRPVPVLSEGLIHAAMKHSQRIGRYWDMNRRGADERQKFGRLLAVAHKNDEVE
jgi:hypothetical protein